MLFWALVSGGRWRASDSSSHHEGRAVPLIACLKSCRCSTYLCTSIPMSHGWVRTAHIIFFIVVFFSSFAHPIGMFQKLGSCWWWFAVDSFSIDPLLWRGWTYHSPGRIPAIWTLGGSMICLYSSYVKYHISTYLLTCWRFQNQNGLYCCLSPTHLWLPYGNLIFRFGFAVRIAGLSQPRHSLVPSSWLAGVNHSNAFWIEAPFLKCLTTVAELLGGWMTGVSVSMFDQAALLQLLRQLSKVLPHNITRMEQEMRRLLLFTAAFILTLVGFLASNTG